MNDYTLTNAELKSLKAALTRAKKKGPDAVVAEANRAMGIFEAKGYPDCWSDWERAKDDAEFEKRRSAKGGSWF
jgi:hypothetical protein